MQRWVERIKPKLVESILHYDDKTAEYFTFATAAEFYRLILSGNCKNFQNPNNFGPDLLLKKREATDFSNGHTKAWNDLLKITSGSDGTDARSCVLQYYNLPQGTSISSTNYEFDYVAFVKAVKKVTNTGLEFKDSELQLDDPVRKRKLYSEYIKKILDRVPLVVDEEKNAIREKIEVIEKLIDLNAVDDEDDIKDIVRSIRAFYNRANDSHIGAAVRMDNALLLSCSKNAGIIFGAIKNGKQALECSNIVESLIRLSKDYLLGLTPFANLLSQTSLDIEKTNQEISSRIQATSKNDEGESTEEYKAEKAELAECREILEKVR